MRARPSKNLLVKLFVFVFLVFGSLETRSVQDAMALSPKLMKSYFPQFGEELLEVIADWARGHWDCIDSNKLKEMLRSIQDCFFVLPSKMLMTMTSGRLFRLHRRNTRFSLVPYHVEAWRNSSNLVLVMLRYDVVFLLGLSKASVSTDFDTSCTYMEINLWMLMI